MSPALPTIIHDLEGDDFVWVASAYALASTALLPATGGMAQVRIFFYSREGSGSNAQLSDIWAAADHVARSHHVRARERALWFRAEHELAHCCSKYAELAV